MENICIKILLCKKDNKSTSGPFGDTKKTHLNLKIFVLRNAINSVKTMNLINHLYILLSLYNKFCMENVLYLGMDKDVYSIFFLVDKRKISNIYVIDLLDTYMNKSLKELRENIKFVLSKIIKLQNYRVIKENEKEWIFVYTNFTDYADYSISNDINFYIYNDIDYSNEKLPLNIQNISKIITQGAPLYVNLREVFKNRTNKNFALINNFIPNSFNYELIHDKVSSVDYKILYVNKHTIA